MKKVLIIILGFFLCSFVYAQVEPEGELSKIEAIKELRVDIDKPESMRLLLEGLQAEESIIIYVEIFESVEDHFSELQREISEILMSQEPASEPIDEKIENLRRQQAEVVEILLEMLPSLKGNGKAAAAVLLSGFRVDFVLPLYREVVTPHTSLHFLFLLFQNLAAMHYFEHEVLDRIAVEIFERKGVVLSKDIKIFIDTEGLRDEIKNNSFRKRGFIEALSGIPAMHAESRLKNILETEGLEPDIRRLAILELGRLGGKEAVRDLIRVRNKKGLIEPHKTEIEICNRALGMMWMGPYEDAILEVVQDRALGGHNDVLHFLYSDEIIDGLADLDLSREKLREHMGNLVSKGLTDIIADRAATYLKPKYSNFRNVQKQALYLLGVFGSPRHISTVVLFFSSKEDVLRESAFEALRKLDSLGVAEQLLFIVENRLKPEAERVRALDAINNVASVHFDSPGDLDGIVDRLLAIQEEVAPLNTEVNRALRDLLTRLSSVLEPYLLEKYEAAKNDTVRLRYLEILAQSSSEEAFELIKKEVNNEGFYPGKEKVRELYWNALRVRGEAVFHPIESKPAYAWISLSDKKYFRKWVEEGKVEKFKDTYQTGWHGLIHVSESPYENCARYMGHDSLTVFRLQEGKSIFDLRLRANQLYYIQWLLDSKKIYRDWAIHSAAEILELAPDHVSLFSIKPDFLREHHVGILIDSTGAHRALAEALNLSTVQMSDTPDNKRFLDEVIEEIKREGAREPKKTEHLQKIYNSRPRAHKFDIIQRFIFTFYLERMMDGNAQAVNDFSEFLERGYYDKKVISRILMDYPKSFGSIFATPQGIKLLRSLRFTDAAHGFRSELVNLHNRPRNDPLEESKVREAEARKGESRVVNLFRRPFRWFQPHGARRGRKIRR